ncbi:MAG: porphobilinogen synthase [Eubacterium sp.]|nr:porphobilinogen synthase [Eubacterium sp.]
MEIIKRPRRLRSNEVLRKMVRETRMDRSSLIYPIFIAEGENIKEEISSMPGQYRYSLDRMGEKLAELLEAGVSSVMFFGIPQCKDEKGSGAYAEDGIVQRALERAKKEFPAMYLIADLCMCEYTSHGHCGILSGESVDNDKTLAYLAKTAVSQVQAGADMVAPSDMMDHRVAAIRSALDQHGYQEAPIMAYSAKYASSYYGPFRDAADSAPAFGDRKTYQMDVHNRREAVKEALMDIEEGADIVMVKPAMAYGDIIREVKDAADVPVAAYSVSGEYAMIKAAAAAGYMDEEKTVIETAVCAYRAGADLYISYFAEELAQYMKEGKMG